MKTVLALLFLIVPIYSFSQEKECSNFHIGEFRYVKDGMPEHIIRNDTLQIEINPIDKVEIYSSIEWTSNCEYTMTYMKILNYPNDVSDFIGRKIYVTIIETKDNWYKVYAKGVLYDGELEFVKIN